MYSLAQAKAETVSDGPAGRELPSLFSNAAVRGSGESQEGEPFRAFNDINSHCGRCVASSPPLA